MLETAAPHELQAHYTRAHSLRAEAFAGLFTAFAALFRAKEKGPHLVARPQAC